MAGDVQRRFADRVKQLRKARGLSQEEMADVLHIHWTNYAKLERGQRKVSLDEASAIARTFGLPIDALVGNPEASAQEQQTREAILVASAEYDSLRREHADLTRQAEQATARLKIVGPRLTTAKRHLDALLEQLAAMEGEHGEHQAPR